jgi:hypothetical protein
MTILILAALVAFFLPIFVISAFILVGSLRVIYRWAFGDATLFQTGLDFFRFILDNFAFTALFVVLTGQNVTFGDITNLERFQAFIVFFGTYVVSNMAKRYAEITKP